MKTKLASAIKNSGLALITFVIGGGVIWILVSLGSCAIRDIKGPTPHEKAVTQQKVALARQAQLETFANEAQVGENTAFIPFACRSFWVDGTDTYFYTGPGDMVPISEIFCRKHSVRLTDQQKPVYSGEYNEIIGFTIIFEKVR